MGEESWLKWLDGISKQRAVVVLAKSLAPELIKDAVSERRRIYAAVKIIARLSLVCERLQDGLCIV